MLSQSVFLNVSNKREFIYKPFSRRYIHQNQTNKNAFDSDPDVISLITSGSPIVGIELSLSQVVPKGEEMTTI
jgi:hypothetical protein